MSARAQSFADAHDVLLPRHRDCLKVRAIRLLEQGIINEIEQSCSNTYTAVKASYMVL